MCQETRIPYFATFYDIIDWLYKRRRHIALIETIYITPFFIFSIYSIIVILCINMIILQSKLCIFAVIGYSKKNHYLLCNNIMLSMSVVFWTVSLHNFKSAGLSQFKQKFKKNLKSCGKKSYQKLFFFFILHVLDTARS